MSSTADLVHCLRQDYDNLLNRVNALGADHAALKQKYANLETAYIEVQDLLTKMSVRAMMDDEAEEGSDDEDDEDDSSEPDHRPSILESSDEDEDEESKSAPSTPVKAAAAVAAPKNCPDAPRKPATGNKRRRRNE